MRTHTGLLFLSFVVAAALAPFVRRLALRLGAVERRLRPDGGTGTIPRLGGLAIFAAFLLPQFVLPFLGNRVADFYMADLSKVLAVAGSASLLLVVGMVEDIRPRGCLLRLVAQIAAAVVVFRCGIRIDRLSMPFGAPAALGHLAGPVTVLWIVLVTNVVMLIDGIDGACAGAVAVAAFAVANGTPAPLAEIVWVFASCITGAALGFLLHGFPHPRGLLGFSGSMLLGFLLAVSSIPFTQKSTAVLSVVVPVIALAVPAVGGFVMAALHLAGRFSRTGGGDSPVWHEMLSPNMAEHEKAFTVHSVAVICALVAVTLAYSQRETALLALAFLCLLVLTVIRQVGRHDATQH